MASWCRLTKGSLLGAHASGVPRQLEICVPGQQKGAGAKRPLRLLRDSQNRQLSERKLDGQLQLARVADALAEEAGKVEQAGRGE